ncbi:hypothetical protein FISHEDRAFT_20358, partial [Fistulina hepatica ATCC 64428]
LLRKSNLKGMTVPGKEAENRLIIKLFADDTTVYLSQHDNFQDLEDILLTWCNISQANFNIQKTEVIPVGTEQYRQDVIRTRKIGADSKPIASSVHIAVDGEAIRILGAWIGNNIDKAVPWSLILKKVDDTLALYRILRVTARWERYHPTIIGRRLITQMFAGGMTQFRTKAQGMPKSIEKKLIKTIRDYMAKGNEHP